MDIPRPPSNVFKSGSSGSGITQVTGEHNFAYTLEKVVCGGQEYAYFDWKSLPAHVQRNVPKFEGLMLFPGSSGKSVPQTGQWSYLKGMLYPKKGWPFPEVLFAVNVVKRFTISFLQAITTPRLILSWLGFLILPWFIKKRIIQNFLDRYDEFTELLFYPYTLEEKMRMDVAIELERWVAQFVTNMGFKSSLGSAVAMIIEYDSAYTYRFQDIMSEVDKVQLLHNPSKELGRLLAIFATREHRPKLNKKIKTIVWALKILFFIPRIRRAFVKATENIDFSKLGLSDWDKYHCLFLDGYEFMGRTAQDKSEELLRLHDGKVPVPEEVIGAFTQSSL